MGAALDPATAAEPRRLRALARRQAQAQAQAQELELELELEILKKAVAVLSRTQTPRAATVSSPPNVGIAPCGGSARCSGCRPVGIVRGKRSSSGRWTSKRRLGKQPCSRPWGSTSAVMAPAGRKSRRVKKGTPWAASACARPCAAGACMRRDPRPAPRVRPTPPTSRAAPPTGYWTSPSRPRPTRSGSATPRICRWRTASGPIRALSRTGAPSTSWAGTWGPPCRKNWSPRPCRAPFLPNRPPQASSSTPTAAASTAATPTGNACTATPARQRGRALAEPPPRVLR